MYNLITYHLIIRNYNKYTNIQTMIDIFVSIYLDVTTFLGLTMYMLFTD